MLKYNDASELFIRNHRQFVPISFVPFTGELGNLEISCNANCHYLRTYYPFLVEMEFNYFFTCFEGFSSKKEKHEQLAFMMLTLGKNRIHEFMEDLLQLQWSYVVLFLHALPALKAHPSAWDSLAVTLQMQLLLNNLFGTYSCTSLGHHFHYSCRLLFNILI